MNTQETISPTTAGSHPFRTPTRLLAASFAFALALQLHAQEAAPAPEPGKEETAPDVLKLDELVVTAVAAPAPRQR